MNALLQQDFEQDRRTLKAARKASTAKNSSCIPCLKILTKTTNQSTTKLKLPVHLSFSRFLLQQWQ